MKLLRLLLIVLSSALLFSGPLDAKSATGGAVHVKGYTKSDGTYVAPHYRSAPNGTTADNWSTKGNVNPYTGQEGTKNPSAAATSASDSVPPANTTTILIQPQAGAALPAAVSALSDRELLQLIYNKLLQLEARITGVEKAQLTSGVTTSQVRSPEQRPAPETTAGPSLLQWRQINSLMVKGDVLRVLGEPATVSNDGNGERWTYVGGGWVQFFNTGNVWQFGGYTSK